MVDTYIGIGQIMVDRHTEDIYTVDAYEDDYDAYERYVQKRKQV